MGKPWSRVIWDVAPIAWLALGEAAARDRLDFSPIPQYDHHYSIDKRRHLVRYVYHMDRDTVFADLFARLAEVGG